MTLADAIRLGSMLRPQTFGALRKRGGSCVLGAAIEALGIEKAGTQSKIYTLYGLYPELSFPLHCPVCGRVEACGLPTIVHLNDDHRWAREAIADWLDNKVNGKKRDRLTYMKATE